MQISSMEPDAIASASKEVDSWKCIEALYFADSFGNVKLFDNQCMPDI